MLVRWKLPSVLLISSLILSGCGGGSTDGEFDFGTGDSSAGAESGKSIYSFRPLAVYETYKEFSGGDADGLYQGSYDYPYIKRYLIKPVIASSQTPTSRATVSDYIATVDGVRIDDKESFPKLQKVIGAPISLRTALVFDVSSSVNQADVDQLIVEAKRYIAAAKDSSNKVIANQEFVVWAFGKKVEELTSGFTSETNILNSRLDQVVDIFDSGAYGASSNLHNAILQAVGRYSKGSISYGNDGNDLYDSTRGANIRLSQLVLFSAGPDTYLETEQSLMVDAIHSQAFSLGEDSEGETQFLYKPVFYHVVGGADKGEAYEALSNEAESVSFLTLQSGKYTFAEKLIENQIEAVDARVDLDNQYLYRFDFLPRTGEHEIIFQSNANSRNSSLLTDISESVIASIAGLDTAAEELSTLVEITGPNGEYLVNNTASFAEVKTFGFSTNWINESFDKSDYSWQIVSGQGDGRTNSNGTFTVTEKTSTTLVLRLTNNELTSKNSATITITN